METEELDAPQVVMQPIETGEVEVRRMNAREVERREVAAGEMAETPPGREAAPAEEAGSFATETCAPPVYASEEQGDVTQMSANLLEEDETQLAAIHELMMRACARGIWLSLGEIADATEFAEASISAQLRHLRKVHHGGHRVEKRRRRAARAGAARREMCDVRRGPVVWEYRVLPRA